LPLQNLIENPGYYVARKIFENHNYKIEKIELNKDGIILKELIKSNSKLVYITPSQQYPTGVVMPISNRLKLLQCANEEDAYIIEDDYDSELNYENRPIPSLQGLDNNHRVIYVGTFSKALSPAIRVSYMVLPNGLLEIYNKRFLYHSSKVCLMTQKTLEKFIEDGYWDRHIRKIRILNKKSTIL
jgi:GntR family transcriptional regulator/MocR family aminotransferase